MLIKALKSVRPEDVPSLLPLHAEDIVLFGRSRRLRLMSWIMNGILLKGGEAMEDAMRVMSDLIGEDDEGEGGKRGEVSRILYEDYLAFVTSLGARSALSIVNGPAIEEAMNAVFATKDDIDNRLGVMP